MGHKKRESNLCMLLSKQRFLTFKHSKSLIFFDREYVVYAVQVIHLLLLLSLLWFEKKVRKLIFWNSSLRSRWKIVCNLELIAPNSRPLAFFKAYCQKCKKVSIERCILWSFSCLFRIPLHTPKNVTAWHFSCHIHLGLPSKRRDLECHRNQDA